MIILLLRDQSQEHKLEVGVESVSAKPLRLDIRVSIKPGLSFLAAVYDELIVTVNQLVARKEVSECLGLIVWLVSAA